MASKRSRDDMPDARPSKRARVAKKGAVARYRPTLPVENKYFDTFFSQTTDTANDWTTAVIACTSTLNSDGITVDAYTASALIPSATGSGYGQVVGSRFLLKQIKCRGEIIPSPTNDSADATGVTTVRVMLVEDTQPNGAQATAATMLTDWGVASQLNFSYQAIASGGGGRFKILADKIIQLQPAMMGTDGTNTNTCICTGAKFDFKKSWKKGLKIAIKNGLTAPAVTALSDVNIYLVAHSSGVQATTIRGCSRAVFCD